MKIKRLQIRNFLGLREIDIIAKDVNVFKERIGRARHLS